MKRNVVGFALFVVFVTLRPIASCQTPNTYTDTDAFNVYSVLMPSPIGGKVVLVVSTTTKPDRCSLDDTSIPDADFREAVQDFQRTNKQEWNLAEEFTRASVKANLIDSKEWKSYFRKGADKGWKKFYRAHPTAVGTVAFSSVGFNNKRTAAVVYREIVSCSECGVGSLHFLKKEATGWTEIKPGYATCGWIS
jgi:hypothetical protein